MNHSRTSTGLFTNLLISLSLIVFLPGCQNNPSTTNPEATIPPAAIDGENPGPVMSQDSVEPLMPNVYANSKYHYKLKLPADTKINNGCLGIPDAECSRMTVVDKSGKVDLEVETLDEKDQYAEKIAETVSLPLPDFANKIWQFNKDDKNPYIKNKTVGELEETTLGGQAAYAFSLSGSYQDDRESFILEDGFYTFIITRYQDAKYLIWFKTSCSQCQDILDTIEFTK